MAISVCIINLYSVSGSLHLEIDLAHGRIGVYILKNLVFFLTSTFYEYHIHPFF